MTNLILTETMFLIVAAIGLFVVREFVIIKNGVLRKIMIAYFCVEVFTYTISAVFFMGWLPITIETLRIIVIVPKVIIKIRLLIYLVGTRKKRSIN